MENHQEIKTFTEVELNGFEVKKLKEIIKELKLKCKFRKKEKLVDLILNYQDNPESIESISSKSSSKAKKFTNTKKKEFTFNNEILRKPYVKNKVHEELKKALECTNTFKDGIEQFIVSAHNLLYSLEHIVDRKALNDITYIMFIYYLGQDIQRPENEQRFKIFDVNNYTNSTKSNLIINMKKEMINEFLSFLFLEKEKNDNDRVKFETEIRKKDKSGKDFITILGELFSLHKDLKDAFPVHNFLNAKETNTIVALMSLIKNGFEGKIISLKQEVIIKFNEVEDLMGEIYEYFTNKYSGSKSKLGQFFTPRKLMKSIMIYNKKHIASVISDKETVNIFEPCMGTAGGIISKEKQIKEINPNIKVNIYGNEIEPDTYRLGLMNIMNNHNDFNPENFSNQNSLTYVKKFKADLIFTNPPFGSDGKKADKKETALKKQYNSNKQHQYLINTNSFHFNETEFDEIFKLDDKNMPVQFLELCINKLNDGGYCTIVLPYGELFFSSSYKKAREHLLKHLNIINIMLVPGGVFTHTGIKTCVISFIKSSEGTKEINYLKTNKACDEIWEVANISIEDIKKEPISSLYLQDYIEDDYIERLKQDIKCEWIKFGDIFNLEKGELQSSKVEENENGEGVFITKGKEWRTIINYKFEEETIIIANASNGNEKIPIHYYNGKYDLSNLVSRLITKSNYKNKINLKYIYYYLLEVKEHIEDYYQKGSCNKSLDVKNFNRMEIPIPTIKAQNKLVNYYDNCYKLLEINKNYKAQTEIMRNNIFEMNIWAETLNGNMEEKYLGEVAEINYGNTISLNKDNNYIYPIIGGGENIKKYSNEWNLLENTIIIARSGSAGCVNMYNLKTNLGSYGFCLLKINKIINKKYLYYSLKLFENNIKKLSRGTVVLNLNRDKLNLFKILIPSLEIQERILKDMEMFENKLERHNQDIQDCKNMIKNQFFKILNKYKDFKDF